MAGIRRSTGDMVKEYFDAMEDKLKKQEKEINRLNEVCLFVVGCGIFVLTQFHFKQVNASKDQRINQLEAKYDSVRRLLNDKFKEGFEKRREFESEQGRLKSLLKVKDGKLTDKIKELKDIMVKNYIFL